MSTCGDGKQIFTIKLEGFSKKNRVLRQDKFSKNGTDAMLGPINMANNRVNNVSGSTTNADGATKIYADNQFLSTISKGKV